MSIVHQSIFVVEIDWFVVSQTGWRLKQYLNKMINLNFF
jgi:hypothetical protein